MTPMPTKIDRNFFLPRMMSAIVPSTGDRKATMISEMLSVVVQ